MDPGIIQFRKIYQRLREVGSLPDSQMKAKNKIREIVEISMML